MITELTWSPSKSTRPGGRLSCRQLMVHVAIATNTEKNSELLSCNTGMLLT